MCVSISEGIYIQGESWCCYGTWSDSTPAGWHICNGQAHPVLHWQVLRQRHTPPQAAPFWQSVRAVCEPGKLGHHLLHLISNLLNKTASLTAHCYNKYWLQAAERDADGAYLRRPCGNGKDITYIEPCRMQWLPNAVKATCRTVMLWRLEWTELQLSFTLKLMKKPHLHEDLPCSGSWAFPFVTGYSSCPSYN